MKTIVFSLLTVLLLSYYYYNVANAQQSEFTAYNAAISQSTKMD